MKNVDTENSEIKASFHTQLDKRCYVDIRKIIIEWQSYQEERFCQIRIAVIPKRKPTEYVYAKVKMINYIMVEEVEKFTVNSSW